MILCEDDILKSCIQQSQYSIRQFAYKKSKNPEY